jgi:hypothetical protein
MFFPDRAPRQGSLIVNRGSQHLNAW